MLELNPILSAICSDETILLPKTKVLLEVLGKCFKKWTPNLMIGGDVPKDLIGRWKMFSAEKLVVAYLLSLKIGFLLSAKMLNGFLENVQISLWSWLVGFCVHVMCFS